MATIPRPPRGRTVDYPTSDGKPMAETETHRDDMMDLIQTLKVHFADDPGMYVSGNMLMYYVEGDKRKHVSPDVFAVRGVPKEPPRLHYLLWEEGQGPDLVIELTSKSTSREDQKSKPALYRDVLKVAEFFLFDPFEEYLTPSMQGHELRDGRYVPIAPVAGRLPSAVLGLHLERNGTEFRLHDPTTGRRLLTDRERAAASEAELERQRAHAATAQAELERQRAHAATAEAEAERLRQEVEMLRRRLAEPR